jgi:hypothetical protein
MIGADEDAEATKWTGDADVDPGAGELIVTPARHVPASTRLAIRNRIALCTKRSPPLKGLRVFSIARRKVRDHLLWIHR